MAVIVEDGTGSNPAANSYGDETGLLAYATARGKTITADKTVLLVSAMDSIETYKFIGYKNSATQPLEWPRKNVYIDGYLQAVTSIPLNLIEGQYEEALAIDAGNGTLNSSSPRVKRKKVYGAVEVEYQINTASQTITRTILNKLSKLINGSSGGNQLTVNKA